MLKIGHRGAMGYAPENTLASFAKALELVIHDDRVDRTTNGKGKVREMTLKDLKELDAGEGQHIPILKEVLDFVNRRAIIDIELKAEGVANSVADIIRQYIQGQGWKPEQFMITSFDHHELKRCHELVPQVPFGPLLAAKPLDYARMAEDMKADGIMPFFEFLDENFVRDAHQRGLRVITWTLNRRDDIKRVLDWGVDGIISNYPDRLLGFE
jgi:glycerophosphoryl diester phosphodiesterase